MFQPHKFVMLFVNVPWNDSFRKCSIVVSNDRTYDHSWTLVSWVNALGNGRQVSVFWLVQI